MQDDTLMLLELTMLTSIRWPPLTKGAMPLLRSAPTWRIKGARLEATRCRLWALPLYLILLWILGLCNRRTRFKMSLQTTATMVLTRVKGDTPDMLTSWLVIGADGDIWRLGLARCNIKQPNQYSLRINL